MKAHLSIDPDSELIDEVVATAANTPDRDAVPALIADHDGDKDKPVVLGDSAYADGKTRTELEVEGFELVAKSPPVRNKMGLFSKDRFVVDTDKLTVTCPAAHVVAITVSVHGGGKASFKAHCSDCSMHKSCTTSRRGRTITIHRFEAILQRARKEQADPAWKARYRADRPIVERKIAHFTRRPWGGRKARTRGLQRVATDLYTRAGAVNWARLAVLGLHHGDNGWAIA
ncbi:MAG: transposase [Actinomycetota bacterium]|nr:transposase [Actinomycetota bacterium]